jgi:LysM repeat protein
MKTFITCVLFIAVTTSISGNEFVVKSFEQVGNDISARKFARTDVNENPCAIIKIVTDISQPFVFESNLGIEGRVEYKENNEIWLYVSEGERQIIIAKDGFITLYYSLPEPVESISVYRLVLKAKENKVSVVIISVPVDAEKFIDGKSVGTGNSFDIEMGQRLLEVSKSEYKSYSQVISVNKNNKVFQNIELVENDPVKVTLKSNPAGARILINDVDEGRTNKQLLKYPGEYSLRITKNNYETISESIRVAEIEDNSWTFNLVKSTATLTLTTTPFDAEIFVNGERKTSKTLELAPGRYQFKIQNDGWETETRQIMIKRGQDQVQSFKLTPKMGKLQVVVEPMETRVVMKQDSREIYSWIGTEYKEGIPVGDYTMNFSLPDYTNESRSIIVEDGITTALNITLKELNAVGSQNGIITDIDGDDSQSNDHTTLTHYVRRGETFSNIARKYNVSLTKLIELNRINNRNRISVGQKLLIPVPINNDPINTSNSTSRSTSAASDYTKKTYTVKKGDTLGQIAENFNTSAKRIRSWNGLSYGQHIYPGLKLTIYTKKTK